ncbi:MAG: serine hydrolase [Planctomycetota bacterium]
MRFLSSTFLLVLTSPSWPAPAQEAAVAERRVRLEEELLPPLIVKGELPPTSRLADRMQHHGVPGVSIAVIDGFEIEWACGYGVLEVGKPERVDVTTPFQAASISKPVAVAAALHFVEQGLLDLDEDVNERLESWKVPESQFTAVQKVTLRRLVSHSAGLTVRGFPGYLPGAPLPAIIQILDGEPPANTEAVRVDIVPGSQCRYSGGGLTVMQLLLEDVLVAPFAQIMRETVLDPLGMGNSTYEVLDEARLARAAKGHTGDGKVIERGVHLYPEKAAAGLWTTASDLARFAVEIMASLQGQSNAVLGQEMTRQMLTVQARPFGLGFQLDGTGDAFEFSHGGANAGFRCVLVAFPGRGQGAVVMTNGDAGDQLIAEVLGTVAEIYGWPGRRPGQREAVILPPDRLRQYAGRYEVSPAGIVLTVEHDGDHLVLHREGWPSERLFATSESTFIALWQAAEIGFFSDPGAGRWHLQFTSPGFSLLGVRAE